MKKIIESLKKSNKRKVILTAVLTFILLVSLIAFSYSYYKARITENNKTETVIKTNNLTLTYTGGTEINCSNIIPGDSCTKTFSVENTSTIPVNYNIYMENITNEFNEDLVYTLTEDTTEVISETVLPETNNKKSYLKTNINIDSKKTKNYTLTIEYKYLSDREQNDYQGKNFKATVGVDTEQNKEKDENEDGIAYCDALIKKDYGKYLFGKPYECDPGDGIARKFYFIEDGDSEKSTEATRPGEVTLILNENIDEDMHATTSGSCNHDSENIGLKYLKEKTSNWNHVSEVSMPTAYQIASSLGNTAWINDQQYGGRVMRGLPTIYTDNLPVTNADGDKINGYYTSSSLSNTTYEQLIVHYENGLSNNSAAKESDRYYLGLRPTIKIKVRDTKPISVKGDIDTVGTQVYINNSVWNVISSDDTTVTMLSTYNLNELDGFMSQDETYSINAVAYDLENNRNPETSTYCTDATKYGCSAYSKVDGYKTNGSLNGTVTEDSTIKRIVDKYVASLNVNAVGRLLNYKEAASLYGVTEETDVANIFKLYTMGNPTQNRFIRGNALRFWIDAEYINISSSVGFAYFQYPNVSIMTDKPNWGGDESKITCGCTGYGVRPVITINKDLIK